MRVPIGIGEERNYNDSTADQYPHGRISRMRLVSTSPVANLQYGMHLAITLEEPPLAPLCPLDHDARSYSRLRMKHGRTLNIAVILTNMPV